MIWGIGTFDKSNAVLFCCWWMILLSFAMVEVLVVFEVNSLQELALACLTAHLCSLLRRLYSAQWVPPFLWARWWALLTLCLLVSSSVVHQVSLWDSVMVFLGQDMSSAEVILLYRYVSSDTIV